MATVAQPTTNTQAATTVSDSSSGANPQALQQAYNSGQGTPPGEQYVNGQLTYTGTAPQGSAANSNQTSQTTPIISANQAIDYHTNAQNFLNQTQQGVANQATTNAQNQANQAANTTQPNSTKSQENQPAGGQNNGQGTQGTTQGAKQPDNSDLTGALNNASSALNAANGIVPPDANAENETQAQYQSEQNDIQSSLNDINDQISTASAGYQTSLAQIAAGTFPLTPVQSSLLQQTQSAVNSLTASAQQTAQLYATVASSLGARQGLEQFQPSAALQNISNAAAKGAAAVAQAELDGVKQMAALQQGFQTEDSDLITKSYDALQASLDAKQKSLESMSTEIQTQAKDAQDEYNTQVQQFNTETQNAISNAFKAVTLDDSEKKNLFDEAMQTSTFNEKQREDMVSDYYKGITASQNATRIGIEQQNANTAFAHLQLDAANSTSATADASAAAANAKVTTPDGKSYINGTNLKDSKAITAAINSGAPVLFGPSVTAMTTIGNTQTELGNLLGALKGAGALDANGNVIGAGRTSGFELKAWAVGNAVPALTNFVNALNGTGTTGSNGLITDLEKLPNTGDLVATLRNNIPAKGDSATTLQNKLSTITSSLNDAENTFLSTGSPNSQPTSVTYNGTTYSVDAKGNMTPQ